MSKIKVIVKRPNWLWTQALKVQAFFAGSNTLIGFTTFWRTVLIVDEHYQKNDKLLAHELTHVGQIEKHGVIKFMWLNVKEFFKNGFKDRYRANSFEVEARYNSTHNPQETIDKFDIDYQ
jgi:hypothetical protein